MHIDHAIIAEILELPRTSLIDDLERVLKDSINRFEYFQNKTEAEDSWNDEEYNFVLHALFLLAELKAEKSLPSVLQLLRQGTEFLDFWFGDFLTEFFWEIIYHLGQNKLPALKDFLVEPDNYAFSRIAVSEAAAQMALYQPDRTEEITDWFADIFTFFLRHTDNDRIIDTDVISFMVSECADIHAKELISTIKTLYNEGLVNPGIPGPTKSIIGEIEGSRQAHDKRNIFDIYARYKYILNNWYYYRNKQDLTPEDRNQQTSYADNFFTNSYKPKPSRNAPCPCGSSRKYKHCCMD